MRSRNQIRMNGTTTPTGPVTQGYFEWRMQSVASYSTTPTQNVGSGTSAVALIYVSRVWEGAFVGRGGLAVEVEATA